MIDDSRSRDDSVADSACLSNAGEPPHSARNADSNTVEYNGEQVDLQNALRTPSIRATIANRALPRQRVAAMDALEALVEFDGDMVLAAQALHTAPQMLLACIVGDQNGHDLLARFLRAYTMTKTFALVNILQTTLADQLNDNELAAKDVAKTLVGLIQGMSSLTDTAAAPQADPFTMLMKLLPPAEREALVALAPSNKQNAA